MLTVASIMTREPLAVAPDCTVERALEWMRERKLRHLPVLDQERLVGLVSERDLMERSRPEPRKRTKGAAPREVVVRDRMSVSLETVAPEDSAVNACRRLRDRRVGCLPVVRDGRLVGVLSESDLLRLYVRVCAMLGADAIPLVEACMSREVRTAAPTDSVAQAFELCRSKGIRHLPVVHDGWLIGIVSDRDLLPVIGRGQGELRRVEDVMTKDFVAVTVGQTPLSEAAACMLQDDFHALPVVESGALKGIVTASDVLLALGTLDERALESAWASERALSATAQEE